MSKRQRATRARASDRARPRGGWILGAVAAAVVAVGGLVWLGQAEPSVAPAALAGAGRAKGDPAAPVTIEVWGDFQCPACRALELGPARQLDATFVRDGTARVVWRNLAFLGPESVWAAEAAECAAEQGQFWAYHDKLFREQAGENRGAFRKERLVGFAADLGLDTPAFQACLESGRYTDQVRAETAAGRQAGVRSTPTLFVNGQKIEGAPRWEQLRALVQAAAAAPAGEAP